jgi:hypothetical protein
MLFYVSIPSFPPRLQPFADCFGLSYSQSLRCTLARSCYLMLYQLNVFRNPECLDSESRLQIGTGRRLWISVRAQEMENEPLGNQHHHCERVIGTPHSVSVIHLRVIG